MPHLDHAYYELMTPSYTMRKILILLYRCIIFCYRDELNDDANESNCTGSFRINNHRTITSKYFEYKKKIK